MAYVFPFSSFPVLCKMMLTSVQDGSINYQEFVRMMMAK